ncbi:hypothetical protein NECAME_10574 [Necator americanus]|uniref:Protein arginine N-methyltransferase n=1 Tax=Necator americanus TaxID=51031 RepID=W2T935_NECAM|nr:hypothetical protein NECAME_10574 [Necator americanus]ETN78124.1 hypothetical protein NECAME_10574 [Necator americanus]
MKYSLYLARKYAAEGWWDRAIRHYLTVLFTYSNTEQREVEFSDEFRTVLESWMCYSRNAESCLSALFAPILNLFPKSVPIITLLSEHVAGNALFSADEGESGISSYDSLKAAINIECDPLMAAVFRVSSANVRSCDFDQWHMLMINDKDRNEKFLDALRNTIVPTDYVLDIGTGTGLMSVFAASCGASKICAIESNSSLYNLAKRILSLNGVDSAKVVRDYSFNFHPEDGDSADVVVSEILDCCAFGEGVIPTFLDAHLRLATNTARFIPADVTLFATLIESPTIYLSHAFTSPSGKEFRSEYVRCSDETQPEPYWCTRISDLPDMKKLSSAQQVIMVDFGNVNQLHACINGVSGGVKIPVISSGTLHAVSVHFRALVWGDEYIDTSENTCWEQGIFPLSYPIRVNEGDSVTVRWTLKGTRFDMVLELPLNADDLQLPRSRELVLRGERDYRTMNNDMLLYAITRLLPSVSRYSWNLDINLSDEETSVVRNLPHFLIDSKDIEGAFGGELDEANSDLSIIVWPIRADGSVSEVFLNSLRSLRSRNDVPPSLKYCGFLTDRLSAHGVLVSSSRLSKLTRVQPSSSCGADLSPIRMYNLLEYRDIDISTFEHHVCSNEFKFLHLGEEDTELLTKRIEVRCTCAGLVEGVLYWWNLENYSTRQDRGAFFIFKEPISVSVGTVVSHR